MKKISYHNRLSQISYLIQKDPNLKELFLMKEEIIVEVNDDYFLSLVATIIAQQLSSKVAYVIFNRLRDLCEKQITPEKIMSFNDETLRSIGLSHQKIKYVRSLAECSLNHTITFDQISHLSDQEIIDMLIQIKGIGIWSAQMFLLFSLGREDVFSVLDLGLRNAVKKIYKNPELTQDEIEKISQRWAPYRSTVSHFLWHAWDNEK